MMEPEYPSAMIVGYMPVCSMCGAVVAQPALHTDFHRKCDEPPMTLRIIG